jgi:hypothetical protein
VRRNPQAFGGEGSHFPSLLLIPAFALVVTPSGLPLKLQHDHDAPLPPITGSWASAGRFAPLQFRRSATRPVSYYALFQGWLLLSQPPGCLRGTTTFPTQRPLGGLSRRSGLFPSRRGILALRVSLVGSRTPAFAVCRRLVGGEAPARQQRSTSGGEDNPRLYLNTFRGEPAISTFDWHFTPTHSSSEPFATDTGAVLHVRLETLQPGHG